MASVESSVEIAKAFLEDAKQAVSAEEFRNLLLILSEAKKNGLEDVKDLVEKVRGVIGIRQDLMRRFLGFVPLKFNESKNKLNREQNSRVEFLRIAPEKMEKSQQSKLPAPDKIEEVWRSILNSDETTEKGRQSEIPSSYRSVQRIPSFDLPGHAYKTEVGRQVSADSGIVESGIDVDVNEFENGGKRKKNLLSKTVPYKSSKERFHLSKIRYIKVEPSKKEKRLQSEIPSPAKIEEVWRGILSSNKQFPAERTGDGNSVDCRKEEHNRIKKALKSIGEMKRGYKKRERLRQSITIGPAPREKTKNESKLIKRYNRVEQVAKVFQLNGEVLEMLEELLKIANKRYSAEKDPWRMSDKILRKVEKVLDKTEKECSKGSGSAFIEIASEILQITEQLLTVTEEGLPDNQRVENTDISQVLFDEAERLSDSSWAG